MIKCKKGSVVLETAIVFSIFLVLVVSVISIIDINRTDLLMQSALEETCEKIQLVPPMRIPLQDLSSTVINAMPDVVFDNENINNIITNVLGGIYGLDDIENGRLSDLLLSEIFGNRISDDIANEYIRLNGESDFFLPDSINTKIYVNTDCHYIEIYVDYSKLTIIGEIDKSIYSAIPLYGDFDMYLNGDTSDDEIDDDIWSADNFSRGILLREKFGANMPNLFPTVDAYNNGVITSILSIDTTAPRYDNDSVLLNLINKEIDELSQFDGNEVKIDGTIYSIDESDITDRELLIIIPSNNEALDEDLYNEIIDYGDEHGVKINVETYGVSTKYSNDE